MKKIAIWTLSVISASVAGAAHAQSAPDTSWYVRADAGAGFQSEINGSPKVEGKTGWTVDLAGGRAFGDNFRGEGEILYSQADDKGAVTNRVKVLAGLLNGYYDFDTGSKFRPFVGAGIGIGQVKLDQGLYKGDDTGLAYQLQTGVSYAINERMSAQLSYRYLNVNDVKFRDGASQINGDYHEQAMTAGFTYKLGL